MWIILALTLIPGWAQRCQKSSSGPVFLQFGTQFSRSRDHSGSEEHPEVPGCYGELDAVASHEGESVGTAMKDATLADCQSACDGQEQCQSFTFCKRWAQCFLKQQALTGQEPTKRNDDCQSFFKASCDKTSLTLKVVSYNLYWWNAFGLKENGWKRDGILNNIKSELKPDTIGFQECDSPDLLRQRTGLEVASKFEGAQGIMAKSKKFNILSTGSRDLEATGHWGTRYMTWVHFEDRRSHRRFWHFNTHWCVASNNSHTCDEATRYRGAKNMVKVIRDLTGSPPEPVIVTGDFNAEMDERGPQHFLKSGFKLAVNKWVDSIFYSEDWELLSQGDGSAAGSDHHPVYAELRLKSVAAAAESNETVTKTL